MLSAQCLDFKVQGSLSRRCNVVTFRHCNAFTLIEIALSLAVIAFALVAIIGVLPTGMQVQRDNRQETIVNQDASVWLDAIRNGQQGLDDLTNYVDAIRIETAAYQVLNDAGTYGGVQTKFIRAWTNIYAYTNSVISGNPPLPVAPPYPITNGVRIVGLLSTPKYLPQTSGSALQQFSLLYSNHVVAFVKAMSGAASDKPPQKNPEVLDTSFRYRMVVELNTNTASYDPTVFLPATNSARHVTQLLQTNLHDLRLIFRWPLLANGDTGNGRMVLRSMVGGFLKKQLQGPPFDAVQVGNGFASWSDTLFFIQPRTYGAYGTQ
jgi:type II secretory pathway pseudopilin PulG